MKTKFIIAWYLYIHDFTQRKNILTGEPNNPMCVPSNSIFFFFNHQIKKYLRRFYKAAARIICLQSIQWVN